MHDKFGTMDEEEPEVRGVGGRSVKFLGKGVAA